MKRNIAFYFTILSALFLALSSQFLGFIFPIIFIIPIYMTLNGLKSYKKSGYLLALALLPIFLSLSVIWIKYFLSIVNNLNNEFVRLSTSFHISSTTAKFITIGSFSISIIMLALSIIVFLKLMKYRKSFQ
ncbi:hypothetical protein ACFIJ5_13240 [Haloimpatiens sp. FM7330]|uniref:hypothetical protein n=1 Tax=Haloimpatiens sp. FM7330 TaxID=3298610 RepID=UPI0036427B27